jgi:hypothetical protein
MIRSRLAPAKFASLACGLALGVALSGGCGVKSAPLAPELVQPARITDLRATADANGVKLTWERPTHYSSGRTMRDLGGFVIVRAEGNGPLTPLIELPVTDRERFAVQHQFSYIDNETVLDHSYRYEIIARTTDNYTSPPSNEVVFTRVKPPPPPNPDTFKLPTPTPLATPES